MFIKNVSFTGSKALGATSGNLSRTAPLGTPSGRRRSEPQTEAEERAGALESGRHRAPQPLSPGGDSGGPITATWQSRVSRLFLERLPCPSARTHPYNCLPFPPPRAQSPKKGAPETGTLPTWIKCSCVKTHQETANLLHGPGPWWGYSEARVTFSLRFTFPGRPSSAPACI